MHGACCCSVQVLLSFSPRSEIALQFCNEVTQSPLANDINRAGKLLAMQVAEQYRDITGMQLSDQLRRELGKPMAAHLSIKGALYRGLTLSHQAAVFIADDECGEQIACLQV